MVDSPLKGCRSLIKEREIVLFCSLVLNIQSNNRVYRFFSFVLKVLSSFMTTAYTGDAFQNNMISVSFFLFSFLFREFQAK